MKLIFLTFVLIFALNHSPVWAQKKTTTSAPAPPPPAKAESERTAGKYNFKTNLFESAVDGFEIYFPARPQRKALQVPDAIYPTDFVVYTSPSDLAVYNLGFIDAPTIITSVDEKNINIESQKNLIVRASSGKLVKDEPFAANGFEGRDYMIDAGGTTIFLRLFFVKQRLFRLMAITPGGWANITPLKQKLKQRVAQNFFNSLKIKNVPAPLFEAVELPLDFGVDLTGDKFFSQFFNVEMRIPAGWNFMTDSETELVAELGKEYIVENTTRRKDLVQNSVNNSRILFVATRDRAGAAPDELNMLTAAAERSAYPEFTPEQVLEYSMKEMLEDYEEVTIKPQIRLIDNVRFGWYETFDKNDKSFQRFFVANINQLAFQIFYTYTDKTQLADLEKILGSIKFKRETK